MLYEFLIRPHLEYANLVWSPYKKAFIEAIVKRKGFPYSLPSVGPGGDLSVQAVEQQVTISHPPGSRLPFTFRQACSYLPSCRASPPHGRY